MPNKISAKAFEKATGRKPEQDDLERVNCPIQGVPGHWHCGWNTTHNRPCFEVGPNAPSI